MLNVGVVWGIDIGDSALKAVKLKRAGKQIVMQDFHIIRYSDLSGEAGTRREGMISQAIAALQAAGLGRDRCIVSIAPQTVFSRFISLPPVDKRRIPEIVLYEARQQIPFNLNEVIWAYESIRKEYVPGEEIEIGLFAVKREVIDAYIAELAPIWKQLHGIQVGPLGLYNFIRHEIPIEQPTVVIDIGAQSTDLLILDGQKFWLRNLPIAGNTFTAILEKRLNIPRAEAEKLKYTVAESRHRRKLLEVLRPVMRDLVAEIQRSVGYYKSLSQAVKFEQVLVTGEGYQLFGLDRFLADQLQYQITPVVQLRNVFFQGDPGRAEELAKAVPSLAVAIGLALQGLGRGRATINLLPEDFIIRRELHSKRFSGLIAAALVWGIVACFWMKENATLKSMTEMKDSGERTLAEVNEKKRRLDEAMRGKDPKRLEMFENFGKHREYYARVIGAISAVIPREIQIEGGFKFSDTATLSATGAQPGGTVPPGEEFRGPRGARPERPAAEAGEDFQKVSESKLVMTFRATCDARKEPVALKEWLPRHLKQAVISPEKIPLVKGVVVGNITRKETLGLELGAGPKWELTADISVGMISPDEADALLAKKREEEAAAAEAATASASAPAAESAAPPPRAR